MLDITAGCKPSAELPRVAPLADPTADATSSVATAKLDGWLSQQSAIAPDSADSSPQDVADSQGPTRPSKLATLIATATEAFRSRDDETLYKVAARTAGSPAVLSLVVRARTRSGQVRLALAAVQQLVDLKTPDAVTHARQLRLHTDTAALRESRKFRQLVHYVPIEVSPTALADRDRLAPLVSALRAAHLPARVGKRWRGKADGATIYYTTELPEAESVAKELRDTLSLPPVLLASRYLTKRRPLVLVLPGEAVGSLNPSGETTKLAAFFGQNLEGTAAGVSHRFTLKGTGFFTWKSVHKSGRTVERTGRYHLGATSIALSYRRIEHEGDADKPTKVQLGRRSSHRFRLKPDGVRLDAISLRVSVTTP